MIPLPTKDDIVYPVKGIHAGRMVTAPINDMWADAPSAAQRY
jgi:hypothetical protein